MPLVLPVKVTVTLRPGASASTLLAAVRAMSEGDVKSVEYDPGYAPLPPGYYEDIAAGKSVDLYAYRDKALREAQAQAQAPAAVAA